MISLNPKNFKGYNLKIYFGYINSNNIFNLCGPDKNGPIGNDDVTKERRRKAFENMIENRNKRDNFYNRLEQSILKEGFRNPILVCAGWINPKFRNRLPDHMLNNDKKILICDRNGGSRLYFGQKYNLEIPCIISDFKNVFENSNLIECKNSDDIKSFYKDKPVNIIINQYGIHIEGLSQKF